MLELGKVYVLNEREMRTIKNAIMLSRNNARGVVYFAKEHPEENKLPNWCVGACRVQLEECVEAGKIFWPSWEEFGE